MVTNQTKLAKTSSTPGKTQLINHFLVNEAWYICDLPGYGYAKVSQNMRASWEKMIANYLQKRSNLMTIFVLIDSRLEPQKLDLEFMAKLGEWGVAFNIIFTKADKSTQRIVAKNVKTFIERMKEDWEFIPRSFVTSTTKFLGRRGILEYIDELNATFEKEPEVKLED
jgi:GTP-binding protein